MNIKKIELNHKLAPYTSWKIGGIADTFYIPKNLAELKRFLKGLPSNESLTWLGAGTNVLIRDGGVRGTVIYIKGKLNNIVKIAEGGLRAEAGVSCSRLVRRALNLGQDASFLAGIPGTIGGALAMNAGAFGDEIWRYAKAVEVINRYGEVRVKPANDFIAGYRHVKGLGANEWFVAGIFHFPSGEIVDIQERVKQLIQKRRKSQPLNELSCGSVFRNPPGDYAARLIETAELKGKTIGGASVSTKHANFIINKNNALASDIEALLQYIIEQVEKKHGIRLVPEVHILGEYQNE